MPDQDKPAPISLNLDSLEREGAPGPFTTVLGGRPVTFVDAMELDYRDLMQLATGDPERFFDVALDPKDRDHVRETKLPTWKLNRLVEAYQQHFGIDPGKLPASSPS